MATYRKVVFVNGELYHVYNRGVERRPDLPLRLSKFLVIPEGDRSELFTNISKHEKLIEIIAYCLMPNHFHFLLKQTQTSRQTVFLNFWQTLLTLTQNTSIPSTTE